MSNWMKRSDFEIILWILTFVMALIFIAFITSLGGCTKAPNLMSAQSSIVYQYDLSGKINGQSFSGVGVIPFAKLYDMRIESEDSVDLLTVTSCHRDFSAQAVIKQGWFNSKKGYDYVFSPAPGLEDSGSCLVRIGVYSSSVGGQSGWAVLDFENPDTTLPAENICNGSDVKVRGVSMCQSKAGLLQVLKFDVPVEVAVDKLEPRCAGQMSVDGSTWNYYMAQGECVLQFREISPPRRKHRHTTVGYNQTFIRTGE